MGSSFVRFNNRGFWVPDGYLELWLHFLAQEVDTFPELPEWLHSAGQYWCEQSKWGGVGCIDVGLDDYATTSERVHSLINLSRKALTTIQSFGDFLSKEALNGFGLDGVWTKDISTDKMTVLVEQFIKLLRGELTSTVSSPDSLPSIWQSEEKI